ncbi:hypothetical protein AcW1_007084 [Taiwanofungus camphoratus]|nr:hypothetical protein AcW2_005895 [Antrodia cinnamomea]KAI0955529.1 hypothetical protein AcW1_007084 [Antrodia cinnamomea]
MRGNRGTRSLVSPTTAKAPNTDTMGQYWDIINLDKKQTQGPGKVLGKVMFDASPCRLVNMLAVPQYAPLPLDTSNKAQSALGALELPPELLYVIFDQVDTLCDAASLCLANTLLFAIGQRRVHELMVANSWAGDRVICLGEYMCTRSLPRGLLTKAERRVLRVRKGEKLSMEEAWYTYGNLSRTFMLEDTEDDDEDDDDDDKKDDAEGVRANEEADDRNEDELKNGPKLDKYTGVDNDKDEPRRVRARTVIHYRSLWRQARSSYEKVGYEGDPGVTSSFLQQMCDSERKAFTELIKPAYGTTDASWALYNLSKREYIRADAVAELTNAPPNGPFVRGRVGLGEVLLARICWSSRNNTAMAYRGELHQGTWAGDRFEINKMERLEELERRGDWTDVTREALEEVVAIWNCEWEGSDWRK